MQAMRKSLFLLWILLGMAFFLCGCQPEKVKSPAPTPIAKPLPSSPLSDLSFSERHSYYARVQGYEFRAEDGLYIVCFDMANEEEPYAVPVDQAWVDTLTGFIRQYDMMAWDGFSGSDSMLLDGTHFSVSFSFQDGTTVTASGYGKFPKNYGDASAAIEAHFLQLLPEDMRDW
jgi:hypothetical protein